MNAARVDGTSTRKGTETAGGVPRRAGTQRYWVIAKDGFGQPDLLTVDLDGTGEALPVFSFEEEAEMFLWLQTTEDGWEVREITPGQLVSIRCRRLGSTCRSASWAWTETTSWSR